MLRTWIMVPGFRLLRSTPIFVSCSVCRKSVNFSVSILVLFDLIQRDSFPKEASTDTDNFVLFIFHPNLLSPPISRNKISPNFSVRVQLPISLDYSFQTNHNSLIVYICPLEGMWHSKYSIRHLMSTETYSNDMCLSCTSYLSAVLS